MADPSIPSRGGRCRRSDADTTHVRIACQPCCVDNSLVGYAIMVSTAGGQTEGAARCTLRQPWTTRPDPRIRERLALTLQAVMYLRGMDAGELATRIGVNRETVYRWVRGANTMGPDQIAPVSDATRRLPATLRDTRRGARAGAGLRCSASNAAAARLIAAAISACNWSAMARSASVTRTPLDSPDAPCAGSPETMTRGRATSPVHPTQE